MSYISKYLESLMTKKDAICDFKLLIANTIQLVKLRLV